MGFFRSSESKSKSKSRFSFRHHSDDAADISPPIKPSAPPPPSTQKVKPHTSSSADPRPPAHPQASTSSSIAPVGLRGTIISSASTSTSTSSSISSPTALQRAATDSEFETQPQKRTATISSSVASAKRASDSQASTDTEDAADFVRTPSESSFLATPRGSFDAEVSSTMNHEFSRSSDVSRKDSHDFSGRQPRHSLVGYSKLQCSMSYKNRKAQGSGGDDPLLSTPSSSSTTLRASFNMSGRRSEAGRSSSSRLSRGSGSYHVASRENSFLTHIDELSTAGPSSSSSSSNSNSASVPLEGPPSADTANANANANANDSSSSSSLLLNGRMSELRLNEASVAALQTRRAFQQMVLAMEDDGDSSDYDSDNDSYHSSIFNGGGATSSATSSGGVVSLGADDYRKFQFRLRQLEELTADQARRQAHMEDTIEHEVAARTSKVVDAMEKKIAMYKQAKDLEVERELHRRLSTEGGARLTNTNGMGARESSMYGGHMPLGTPMTPAPHDPVVSSHSDLKAKPLDKLFHPRRTRRRMELLREREEQQKREMEQFREFIRTTEMHSARATGTDFGFHRETSTPGIHRMGSEVMGSETARASIKALRDPHITEDLLGATQHELIEMICVLRKHVSVQETQLDQAKKLISAAIEAREEAEETAREAVELTMELDTRLERASQEIVVIKDELRRSSDFSVRASYLFPNGAMSIDRNSHVAGSMPGTAAASGGGGDLLRTASFPNF